MKIKTKKQLNLPQLIEWAMKNDMHERSFCGDRYGDAVHFDENEDMLCDHVSLTETFTVEVEEEITEDTEFKSMVEVTTDDLFATWEDASISTWKSEYSKEFHAYIDGEFKCIWRDGKLVE